MIYFWVRIQTKLLKILNGSSGKGKLFFFFDSRWHACPTFFPRLMTSISWDHFQEMKSQEWKLRWLKHCHYQVTRKRVPSGKVVVNDGFECNAIYHSSYDCRTKVIVLDFESRKHPRVNFISSILLTLSFSHPCVQKDFSSLLPFWFSTQSNY